jgi:cell division protein FtsQ
MKRKSALKNQAVKRRRKRDVFAAFSVFRRVGSGFLKVFLVFTVIVVISLSFLFLYRCMLSSPHMKLEQVDVEGVDEEIRRELIQLCGLNSDISLLALNLNQLKQQMGTHPWIRSVTLKRRFPHTLIVRAEKEVPLALVVMDRIYYVNRWGKIFKEVSESEDMDFPFITGFSKQGSKVQKQLDMAAYLMRTLESEEGLWSLDELSEIHIENDGGMSMYFGHLAAEIKVRCEDLASKMEGLKRVTEHLSQTGRIHQVTGIDLNHVDGAIVSFRKG